METVFIEHKRVKESKELNDIKRRMKELEELPAYGELKDAQKETMQLIDEWQRQSWVRKLVRPVSFYDFCRCNIIFNVPNAEFVDALAEEMRGLDASPIIEICAGDGKLSYHLRERGIDILATDDNSWYLERARRRFVERLSYSKALKRYQPGAVVGSWLPSETEDEDDSYKIGLEVLGFPSVRHFISIGECPDPERYTSGTGFSMRYLEEVQKYCVSFCDYENNPPESKVILFSRK